jgi:hypothetical protein|eukprot:CAMPEP_0174298780 /NCGR_PEP_ID=MMETSP0809-20121228/54810_1 /TAXON_ID=73025 ORGANISM="Eutreptiella gymnastica-like, Strain CCMP1594" /NCGR_SAMPLE_ID=MMETSP0809 /ASSEMBLY_ACC=CAM_ASM_000658 /LENGTH=107 /DNA_ID=CAMNT_0015403477 /DNA_START=203 /DNA_END=526 /DNA_ORIENTATION=-
MPSVQGLDAVDLLDPVDWFPAEGTLPKLGTTLKACAHMPTIQQNRIAGILEANLADVLVFLLVLRVLGFPNDLSHHLPMRSGLRLSLLLLRIIPRVNDGKSFSFIIG